jgi:hypothetical protein
MKSLISEFSYGYALTDELIHWRGTALTAAPVFPSLFAEGQPGGGYDLRLDRPGIPLFLQFKLSDCMTRRNANEVLNGLLDVVFYRMHLRKRSLSMQHQMLLALESQGNEVYYAAPAFHEPHELNAAYLQHRVKDRSILLEPSLIGPLPDDDEHHIAFRDNGPQYEWHFCSTGPREPLPPLSAERFLRRVQRAFRAKGSDALEEPSLARLRSQVLRTAREERIADVDIVGLDRLTLLQQIAYLSQTFLNCQMFVVQSKRRAR